MFYNHCQKEDRQPAPLQFLFCHSLCKQKTNALESNGLRQVLIKATATLAVVTTIVTIITIHKHYHHNHHYS